jgi:hypothetical protein
MGGPAVTTVKAGLIASICRRHRDLDRREVEAAVEAAFWTLAGGSVSIQVELPHPIGREQIRLQFKKVRT